AYADMASNGSIANSPIPSIMSGAPYMHGEMPALNLNAVQGLPGGMSVAEHESIYASHHADMGVGVDPAALGTPDQSDLTNSFVNAGIAAGINMMADPQGLPMGSDAGDIAAAASLATNAVMASGYYDDRSGDAHDMPSSEPQSHHVDSQWASQPAETPSALGADRMPVYAAAPGTAESSTTTL
ncbi:hypothetical protein H4R19_006291, partial [Coemansia spiralis]